MKQTIIGAGGAIGIPLAKELSKYTDQIRLVSRKPVKVNEGDELLAIDVIDPGQLDKAIAGSEVVYITIGFPYKTRVWQDLWPPFIRETIKACKKHQAKLVFFDNVYMYAKSEIPFMTESALISPPSGKGKIRSQVQQMIMDEVEKNKLTALIARGADFYGPDNQNSVVQVMAADNLAKGKKAQAFGDVNKIHTYTYTPDAARATAILGNTPAAYQQVWHVPTTKEKLIQLDWIRLIAKALKKEPRIQKVPKWQIQALGIFVPVMREFPEMLYQYEQDYIFDSSKFEKEFGVFSTPPEEGIEKMMDSYSK